MKNYLSKFLAMAVLGIAVLTCSDSGSDSCEPITCFNGGTSNSDCGCECPLGFTGANCSQQITPSKITIAKATVKAFPLDKPDGSSWDTWILDPNDQLPDILIIISLDGNILYQSGYYENAIGGTSFYEFVPDFDITDFAPTYYISIWDFDGASSPELMTAYDFDIYTGTDGFPTTMTIMSQTNEILVDFELEYQW